MTGWSRSSQGVALAVALSVASCAAFDTGAYESARVRPCRCDGSISSNDLAAATGAGRTSAAAPGAASGPAGGAASERWRTVSLGSAYAPPATSVPTAIGGGPPASAPPANAAPPVFNAPMAPPSPAPTLNAPSPTGVPGQYYNVLQP